MRIDFTIYIEKKLYKSFSRFMAILGKKITDKISYLGDDQIDEDFEDLEDLCDLHGEL